MFKETLKEDVKRQVGSIHSLNAPNAIGYLFTVTPDGNEVYTGMFASHPDEINKEQWRGFYSIEGLFYDLDNPRDLEKLC